MQVLSFDIGGSKIAYSLINEQGELIFAPKIVPTPKSCDEIENILKQAVNESDFDGLAVATAGVVNNNRVCYKPNNLPLGYENIDFRQFTSKPVLVENDANSAAWAEYQIGVSHNCTHNILLSVGTDAGCGIIIDGKLVKGKFGGAGEVSFSLGGRHLAKFAAENNLPESDCFKIYNLAKSGNISAQKTYEKWENELLFSLKMLKNLLDSEMIVLSGSLSQIVDYSQVQKKLNLLMPNQKILLKQSILQNNAPLIGVALLLREKMNG